MSRFLVLISLFISVNVLAKPGDADLQCKHIYGIQQLFLSQHIKFNQLDKDIQNRVVEQYIKRLDPTKTYLTQADVDKIKSLSSDLFEKLKNKDCVFLSEIQKIVLERVQQRADFAKDMLGKDYKLDTKVEILFDSDKKPFPATDQDANDYLKKYVHFQISNYLATDMKLDEAKTNVKKNWERMVKRTKETKEDDVYAAYLDSFARALDPHTTYFSRDALEEFQISMSLSLEGIGATLSQQEGFTVIEALVPGGAAARSNLLQPQDKIIAVGQGEKGPLENVIEMDLRDVVKRIRGEKGTKVRLTILRKEGEGKKRFDVVLVRDKIKLEDEAVSISYIDKEVNGIKKKIGVINFPSFYADSKRGGRSSANDVRKIIVEAKKNKVDGLVLDLSSNGGGSLDDAVKIAGMFFQTGSVVKSSSRDEGKSETALKDVDPSVDWQGPLVLLTSRISASASEIVAGTLQDYKRAVVVGADHTFGKGSIQSVVEFPQGLGAMKVTVGMFYTAGGFSTQHRGVEADISLPGVYSTDDIGEKSLDYSLPPKKIEAFLSPEAYVKEGAGAWSVIKEDWLKSLREKSKQRVEKNEEFKKIVSEINKAKEKGKIVKIAEVLKDKDSKEKKEKAKKEKTLSKAEKEKEYLKRPDIVEASNVLLDLITLESAKALSKN